MEAELERMMMGRAAAARGDQSVPDKCVIRTTQSPRSVAYLNTVARSSTFLRWPFSK
jgi:hypothetical protein